MSGAAPAERRMRLLHVVPTYLPALRYGGPIASVHALCRALSARGHRVEVFTTNVDGPGESDVPLGEPTAVDGIPVTYFPSRRLRRLYRSPPLARALRARVGEFDLVHTHSIFLWPTWAAARAARRAGVPYVCSPRGMLERGLLARKSRWVKTAWLALVERRNLEGAAAVHFTSRREEREAAAFGYRLRRGFVVPNGADAAVGEGARAPAPPAGDPGYLLFLGRISWKKGLERLVAAVARVPGARLVVAGNDEEGRTPALAEQARREGCVGRVAFVGRVDGAAKRALLEGAYALVLPSLSENFGNVVLEAMAHGCPVVVTPEVGAAEIVAAEGAGLVAEGEPQQLAAALAGLLSRPEEARRMGERGREAVRARYLWPQVAEQMERRYREVLGGPC